MRHLIIGIKWTQMSRGSNYALLVICLVQVARTQSWWAIGLSGVLAIEMLRRVIRENLIKSSKG